MTTADALSEHPRARMQRKKELIEKKIDAATVNAGVLLVNKGNVSCLDCRPVRCRGVSRR